MVCAHIVDSVRQCPWVRPLFLRVALSVMIILYVLTGAAIFVVLLGPSSRDLYVYNKVGRLRNDTASLLVAELQGNTEAEKVTQTIARLLLTYEHELERSRVLTPVDELFLSTRDPTIARKSVRGTDFENALYFTLSLLTATASGSLLRLPNLTQFIILVYTAIGVPLLLIWVMLMGRSMAQFWIMLCLHTCCCGMTPVGRADTSLFKRLLARFNRRRSVTPEPSKSAPGSSVSSNPISIIDELVASERNVLVQPENVDEYFRLMRSDLVLPSWTLCLFFLLYAVFGATFGAVSHGVSFMTALFYGYLIFTTIGGVTPNLGLNTSPSAHLARFSGDDLFAFIVVQQDRAAKVIWMLYFLMGYVLLAGILYMGYLFLTWRCSFCNSSDGDFTRGMDEEANTERSSIDVDMGQDNHTPVEILPRRFSIHSNAFPNTNKVMDSRRSSIATLRQTSLEFTPSDLETGELRTLAEADEDAEADSDSGISKAGSDRMVEPDRVTVRSVRSIHSSNRNNSVTSINPASRSNAGSALSKRSEKSGRSGRRESVISTKTSVMAEMSVDEDLREEVDPEDDETMNTTAADNESTTISAKMS